MPGEIEAPPVKGGVASSRRLAKGAAEAAKGLDVPGSESQAPWEPYFVAATAQRRCEDLSAKTSAALFGSALYPEAEVHVEPLTKKARWCVDVQRYFRDPKKEQKRWQKLVAWFDGQDAFVETAWASVRAKRAPTSMRGGSVGLWLLLGRLKGGHVAGLVGLYVAT